MMHIFKNILVLSTLILFNINIFSQNFKLINFPKDYQLYKRQTDNTAQVEVSGVIYEVSNFTSITLNVYKNSTLLNSTKENLNYLSNKHNFTLNTNIQAELSNYTFELVSNTGEILHKATNVVAGDIYIMQGQSNSVRHSYSYDNFPFENNFIRTCLSTGDWTFNPNLGVYGGIGYGVSNLIVNNQKIPIALFSGGKGGKPIFFFQRNDSNKYAENNYGYFLNRYTLAGFVPGDVKAVFWYQGESDLNNSRASYINLFSQLHEDWEEDFNPDNYYVFQVRYGCGVAGAGDYKKRYEIPEAQRQLPNVIPNLKIISTNGASKGIDDCHYFGTDGYSVLAKRLYDLVAFDFYDSGKTKNIYSPDISNIQFTTENRDQITFELNPPTDNYTWENGVENGFWVENYNTNTTITVTNGSITGNIVTLNLSEAATTPYAKISYLGHSPENSPFIKNQNGIGMLSFKDLAIQKINSLTKSNVGNWTYYYETGDLLNPIFAIEHMPIGVGANSLVFTVRTLQVDNNGAVISSIDTNTKRGVFSLSKFWNLEFSNELNGWVNLRFFYDRSLEVGVKNKATDFKNINNSLFLSPILYIKTDEPFYPPSQMDSNGFSIKIEKITDVISFGTYNSKSYTQFEEVIFNNTKAGGTVIMKVDHTDSSFPAGTIRYNSQISKFQGFDGTLWIDFN